MATSRVMRRARSRTKQETGKALRAPPREKKIDGKKFERWGGRSSKEAAERDAQGARGDGYAVRVLRGKTESGKPVYWLYARKGRK